MEKNSHTVPRQLNKISFYIVAHADDWQLFMHPHVYNDLVSPDCKIIFIFTTAGDAGMDEKYWAAREEGTKSSVRFCLAPLSFLTETGGCNLFNGHPVHWWSINDTTSYFLRLPDGNLNGKGHGAENFQSLSRLRSAQVDAITAIDNSTTYQNWPDFVETLESIISLESGNISYRCVHYLNPDTVINPNDHADHIATGFAVQQISILKTFHQWLFVGYSVCEETEPLPLPELFYKAGMFATYEKAVYDGCGYSTLKEDAVLYARWCFSKPKFKEVLPAGN